MLEACIAGAAAGLMSGRRFVFDFSQPTFFFSLNFLIYFFKILDFLNVLHCFAIP